MVLSARNNPPAFLPRTDFRLCGKGKRPAHRGVTRKCPVRETGIHQIIRHLHAMAVTQYKIVWRKGISPQVNHIAYLSFNAFRFRVHFHQFNIVNPIDFRLSPIQREPYIFRQYLRGLYEQSIAALAHTGCRCDMPLQIRNIALATVGT